MTNGTSPHSLSDEPDDSNHDLRIHTTGDVSDDLRRATHRLIQQQLCGEVFHSAETLSTNTDALQELGGRGPKPDLDGLPILFLTDQQTAGRGRSGNQWQSPGDALTFSMLQPWQIASESGHLLSLAVGVAIAQAIEHDHAPLIARLKWPNDVYVSGGKVAGILIESLARQNSHVVIGIGVNVDQAPALDGAAAGQPTPQSLAKATGSPVSRAALLISIVESLAETLRQLQQSPSEILNAYRQRCLLAGKPISLLSGQRSVSGTCIGVLDNGALEVQTPTGIQQHFSGETRLIRSG
ncbi:biotin--[acetyl-CoA-carboxylase] ligase [Stieleria varia]|nr:biotin--[acetyl-CoA-carboxylase] ligase [Stieleria varia]